jgi:F-type H+-transporting ATPase subunit gamma
MSIVVDLKKIKASISYLAKFKDISRSVQLIAIAQLRKLRTRIEARDNAPCIAVEFFADHDSVTHVNVCTIVVITSERSCCGKLNSDVFSASREAISSHVEDNKLVKIISVGYKGYNTYKDNPALCKALSDVELSSLLLSYALTLCIIDTDFDKCLILFSRYYKIFEQVASVYEFKSYGRISGYLYANRKHNMLFDLLLSADLSIHDLYVYYVCLIVLDALSETKYSELGCRAYSMEIANRNASELIKENTLLYNKVRQSSITTALLEVISGAQYS